MSNYQYIYVMKDLCKTFSTGRDLFKHIWLSFFPGAKIGIIGQNGSGKSTLLKIMAGLDSDFRGECFAQKGTKIGFLPQEPELDVTKNVLDNIKDGLFETYSLLQKFEEISQRFTEELSDEEMNQLLEEQSNLQERIDALDAWDLDRKINIAMDALRCPLPECRIDHLSGGEKRRVALCRLLLQHPDLLLLDEPTNHLDAESVAWLERHLKEYSGTVVLITHDRYFLDNVVSWILELDRGEGIPFEGTYSKWLENKQKRLSQEQKHEGHRQKQIEKELEWIKQSPKGRQSKSKARIQAYEDLLNQNTNKGSGEGSIVIPSGPRLGDQVIEANNLQKSYGDKLLFENISFLLPRGAIVGVIGPNGAGKTTLSRLITGQEAPDLGSIRIGDTVSLGYVDQSRDSLNANKTLWEEISDGHDMILLGKKEIPSRAYCSLFNFKGADQQKRVSELSGGERNRVHLAKVLKSNANVIILDEPTNDLDIETLRSLEEGLLNFAGCALVISHDRFFLDRIATHIIAFEGNSQVVFFEGNYESYDEDRKRRLGASYFQPTRVKYKPLHR